MRLLVGLIASSVLFSGEMRAQRSSVSESKEVATLSHGRYIPLHVMRDGRARMPAALERRVTVRSHLIPLQNVLLDIANQAGFGLSYSDTVARSRTLVSLDVAQVSAAEALARAVEGTPWSVLVTREAQVTVVSMGRRVGAVVGQVTDVASGRPVVGAEVLLDKTQWHTATDSTGWYRLTDIDSGAYNLTVRRLGYLKHSRPVTVRERQTDTVDVKLESMALPLDELITTATGKQRRRDLGNAITTINADSVLQTAPIRNLTDLLEDRVPGLTVQHTSGAPGDPSRLRLRGLGSALRSNDPVVIVDGVRVYAAQSDARSGNLTNSGTVLTTKCNVTGGCVGNAPLSTGHVPAPSPLDQIDPNIIEKIEVFKGPSAATLYGADAANGVIVVTTKKGSPGPTRWNGNIAHGRTTAPGRWPEGYFRWGYIPERGGNPWFCALTDTSCEVDSLVRFQALNDPSLTIIDQGRRTQLSLTASGGSQALTYSVTGTYGDETGLLSLPAFEAEQFRTRVGVEPPDWMLRPHHLKNWSVTSNVSALLGPTADVSLRTTLVRMDQQRSTLENHVKTMAGAYVDRVNKLYYAPTTVGDPVWPVPTLIPDYYQRTTASSINFTTGIGANWRPRSWIDAWANAGLNLIPREDETFQPAGYLAPSDSGALSRGVGRSLVSTLNIGGGVRRPLRWGFIFKTRVGIDVQTTTTSDVLTEAAKLQPGMSTINGASVVTARETRTNTSVFGWSIEPQIVSERISLSTGFRLDGGSAYGTRLNSSSKGGLLGLPKFNGSWVISEEPFFPFKSLFSSLRLRGAYGQAQVQPGPTDRLRTYRRRIISGTGLSTVKIATVGNADLRPERSAEFEGGFDADLFDSRVMLEFTAYHKTQIDALMPVGLPPSVNGGGQVLQNIGNIRNSGLEVVFGLTPVQTSALTLTTRLIYSSNTNVLTKLGKGVAPDKVNGLVESYPVRGRWAKPILGYTDANDNGVIDRREIQTGDSLVYMGRLLPDYTTSLSTDLSLFRGAVVVSAGFSYESGAMQIDETARTNWVLSSALVDPSTPFGAQAAVLALDSTEYGMMQDISTFRFQSFSMIYRAPARLAKLLHAQQLRLAVQGSNLGLHSTYKGKDPDVTSWSPGETVRDTGQLPLPRTWQVTLFFQY